MYLHRQATVIKPISKQSQAKNEALIGDTVFRKMIINSETSEAAKESPNPLYKSKL